MSRNVPERLRDAAQLFEERNHAYGGNYLDFGEVMSALVPGGVTVATSSDWRRLVLLCHMMTKLTRYARNLSQGGHADSLEDLAVYAMMAAETDDMVRAQETTDLDDDVDEVLDEPETPEEAHQREVEGRTTLEWVTKISSVRTMESLNKLRDEYSSLKTSTPASWDELVREADSLAKFQRATEPRFLHESDEWRNTRAWPT